jgi:hypothetical protein
MLLTPDEARPCVKVPVLVAVEQLRPVIMPAGRFTVLVKVQVCPPKLKAKLAVPLDVGVPVMLKLRLPAPLAKVPAERLAVSPVTPVEVAVLAV